MTELETDLRAWMQECAARVHASPTILQTDYRPRTRGWRPRSRAWRPRLAIGGGVAAVAGTLTAVLSLTGGAGTAFAGWSAQPTTPSASQLQTANGYCAANIPDPNTTTQQLVDSRGPYTIIVYAGAAAATQTYNFCTVGPSFRNASGWTSYPPVTPAAGKLFLWTDHTSYDDGQPYGTMIASAGSGVTGATLKLTDGTVVTATVQNGYVAAWWPGDGHIASAQLTTANGTQTQAFSYPCDVHSCTGGPHGGPAGGGLYGG
jgi:hypothetical protein